MITKLFTEIRTEQDKDLPEQITEVKSNMFTTSCVVILFAHVPESLLTSLLFALKIFFYWIKQVRCDSEAWKFYCFLKIKPSVSRGSQSPRTGTPATGTVATHSNHKNLQVSSEQENEHEKSEGLSWDWISPSKCLFFCNASTVLLVEILYFNTLLFPTKWMVGGPPLLCKTALPNI